MRILSPRLGLLLAFPLLAGCGPRTGHVIGKVTYKGAPVPAGWIQFRPADPAQNSVTVGLDADGNFAADLPAGEVLVSIDNREWEPRPARLPSLPAGIPLDPETQAKIGAGKPAANKEAGPAAKGQVGKYVPIPAKYYDLNTSGLKITVKGGAQAETIELTD